MRDAHQDATLQLGWRKTSRRRWQASSSALWHEHPKNVAKFERGAPSAISDVYGERRRGTLPTPWPIATRRRPHCRPHAR